MSDTNATVTVTLPNGTSTIELTGNVTTVTEALLAAAVLQGVTIDPGQLAKIVNGDQVNSDHEVKANDSVAGMPQNFQG